MASVSVSDRGEAGSAGGVASESERVARAYFAAVARHDVSSAVAMWRPGGSARHHGLIETTAPDGVRDFLHGLLASLPDLSFQVSSTTSEADRCFVRWRMVGTFNGAEALFGIKPTGGRLELEGAECLTIADGLITANDAYGDVLGFLRGTRVLPPADSRAERRLLRAVNLVTRALRAVRHPNGAQ
jgi:predicted ester cyclase